MIIAPQAPAVNIAAKFEQENYGYALYVARQPVERCTNRLQRIGWQNAYNGQMAAADCETAAYLGGNR